MSNGGVIQIPFDAFRLIDVGQTLGLQAYQALYCDHADPVGLSAVIQGMGSIKPSDSTVKKFNDKWNRNTVRSKLGETGVELVTGKSSTSALMAKTQDGESTLIALSFLLEVLPSQTAGDIARCIIDSTPQSHIRIKPRYTQITDVIKAVQSQTACVSWKEELKIAEEAVVELPSADPLLMDRLLYQSSFDIPAKCMASFYQALCTVSRFPDTYRCSLQTSSSIIAPYVLAHSVCGLRVCVVVNGETVHGSAIAGKWQVRLERNESPGNMLLTKVKLGRTVEDLQDLLVLDKQPGPVRANRVDIEGIGQACTLQQGLGSLESEEIAVLAIAAAISALSKWEKQILETYVLEIAGENTSYAGSKLTHARGESGRGSLVNRRLLLEHIEVWWGIKGQAARRLLQLAEGELERQPEKAS